jgi:hypothetical protein
MSDRMVAVWVVDAGVSRAARPRERKVRTPQSSVPDNVRDGGFKATLRKVPQRTYRLGPKGKAGASHASPRVEAQGKGEKVR